MRRALAPRRKRPSNAAYFAAAAEATLSLWVDGPRRSPEVGRASSTAMGSLVLRSYELRSPRGGRRGCRMLDPPRSTIGSARQSATTPVIVVMTDVSEGCDRRAALSTLSSRPHRSERAPTEPRLELT